MSTQHPRRPHKVDKVAGQAERLSRKAEQLRASAEQHAAKLDQIAARLEALEVWTRHEPASRRPRLTREEIAAAAVRIADAEGFAALSMRRLAAELDVGTMSLYHYVRTKDELLTLVNDHVMGEVVVPPEVGIPDDWREAMVLIATLSRAAIMRHAWMFDVTDDPPLGPNSVRHFDQSLQALSTLDAPLRTRIEILVAVDEYVFGHCLHARNNAAGGDDPAAMRGYIEGLMASGEYPGMQRLIADIGYDAAWNEIQATFADDTRFERNLRQILDGLAP